MIRVSQSSIASIGWSRAQKSQASGRIRTVVRQHSLTKQRRGWHFWMNHLEGGPARLAYGFAHLLLPLRCLTNGEGASDIGPITIHGGVSVHQHEVALLDSPRAGHCESA